MKKALSLFLALLMVFSLLPVSALADGEVPEEPTEAMEEVLPAEEPAEEALPEEPAEPAEEPAAPEETPAEEPAEAPAEEALPEAPAEEVIPEEEHGEIALLADPEPSDNILTSEFIPDAAFLSALKGKYGDELSLKDAAEVVFLDVSDRGITDVTGLMFFSGVLVLNVSDNALTELSVDGLKAMTYLDCSGNPLRKLSARGCTALANLARADTEIISLDLSDCSSLTKLNTTGLKYLAELNLSGCTALKELNVSTDCPSVLNVSGCTSLTSLECAERAITELNVRGCTALETLDCGGNALTSLDLSGCESLQEMHCDYNALTSLDVSGLTALKVLYCSGNALTSLKVSGCTALETLYASSNSLTELDVSGCTALEYLDCCSNALTELDVSGCTALEYLDCCYNALIALNVSGCVNLVDLNCCNNALTSLDVSGCTALEYLDCCSNALTELDMSGCESIYSLYCDCNALTELYVSGCESIYYLYCDCNALTELYVSGCGKLCYLNCSDNALTELDVSGCASLIDLYCSDNALTELETSGCNSLEFISCPNNRLMDLDLSGLPELSGWELGTQYPLEPVNAAMLHLTPAYTASIAVLEEPTAGELDSYETEGGWSIDEDFQQIIAAEGTPDRCEYRIWCETFDGDMAELIVSRPVTYTEAALRVDPDYMILQKGQDEQDFYLYLKDKEADPSVIEALLNQGILSLKCFAYDAGAAFDPENPNASTVVYLDEGSHSIVPVDVGTAYVDVNLVLLDEMSIQTCRIRVDVVDEAPATEVLKATLPVKTATVELFSTDYTEFDVLLDLERWYEEGSKDPSLFGTVIPVEAPEERGVAITEAKFEDVGLRSMFTLVPMSDRRLAIVPNNDEGFIDAVYNGDVKWKSGTKLSSKIVLTVSNGVGGGTEVTTEQALTVAVKTTQPKLKATAIKFNSLLNEENPIAITGGEILYVWPDAGPDWAELDETEQGYVLRYVGAPCAKLSGTVTLDCVVKGWAVTVPVTVKVSASAVKPKITFPAKSITFIAGSYDERDLIPVITPAQFIGDFDLVSVIDAKTKKPVSPYDDEVPSVYIFYSPDESGEPCAHADFGAPYCTADGKTHSYIYTFAAGGATAKVTVKVLPETTPIKLTVKTSGTIDFSVPGSSATFIPTLKNMNKLPDGSYNVRLRITNVQGEKKGAAPVDGWDIFYIPMDESDYDYDADAFFAVPLHVYAGGPTIPAGYTWYAYVDAINYGGNVVSSAKVKIPVKLPKGEPSVTAKVSGKFDLLRTNELKLTLSVRNLYEWSNEDVKFDVFKTYDGATASSDITWLYSCYAGDYAIPFGFDYPDWKNLGDFRVNIYDFSAIHPKDKFAVQVTVNDYSGGSVQTKLINLPTTVGKAALKLAPAKLDMALGDPYAETDFAVTFTDPTLRGAAGVALDLKSSQIFDITANADGTYALHWKDNKCPIALKSGKTVSVKVGVWMLGSAVWDDSTGWFAGKPNATLTLKVTAR